MRKKLPLGETFSGLEAYIIVTLASSGCQVTKKKGLGFSSRLQMLASACIRVEIADVDGMEAE